MADPVFDPTQPFEVEEEPKFDPSKPFEVEGAPRGFVEGALHPITSYPETYREHREAGLKTAEEGAKEAYEATDPTKPHGPLDTAKALYGAGKGAMGALGYITSPISAALQKVVGEPTEKLTGSPFAGKTAEAAVGLMIPGYGMTKLPMKTIPSVPAAVAATDEAKMLLARQNAEKAREFTDPQGRPMELSFGEAAQDPDAWRYENMAGRGAYGKEAQEATVPVQEERFQIMHGAGQKIGEELGGNRGISTPQEASNLIADEIKTYADILAKDRAALEGQATAEEQAQRGMVSDQARTLDEIVHGPHAPIADAREAGETVGQSVRSRAAAERQAVDAAYERAHALPGQFHAGTFEGIGQRIKGELSDVAGAGREPVIVDDITTPIASRALQTLDNGISRLHIQNRADPFGQPNPENIIAVNLRGVDQARKQLTQYYRAARGGANPSDTRAMAHIIDEFDNQVERAVSNGLFTGDPQALEALQNARAAYRRYAQTYRPRQAGDDVGQAMRRIIDRNATPEETARMLVGSGAVGNAGLPVRLAARMEEIFGRTSPEWSSIRQALWQNASRVRNAAGEIDPLRSAANIDRFASSTLARQVFEPQELVAFRNHAQAVRNLEGVIERLPERAAVERASSDYERLFGGADIGGSAGATMRKIVAGTATPDEITSTLFKAIHSDNPGNVSRFIDAVHRIAGPQSEAAQAMRQGVWQRLVGKPEGMDPYGAQKLSQDIFKFLGKSVAGKLYTPEELAMMRRYAEVVRLKAPTWSSKTNSDTAPALMAIARKLIPHGGVAALGAHAAGLPGYAAGHMVDRLLGSLIEGASSARHARNVKKSLSGWERARGGSVCGDGTPEHQTAAQWDKPLLLASGGKVPGFADGGSPDDASDYDPALEAEIARTVAASRMKQAAQPEAGRQMGPVTEIPEQVMGELAKRTGKMAYGATVEPILNARELTNRALSGEYISEDPEAGGKMLSAVGGLSNITAPFAAKGSFGALGGRGVPSAPAYRATEEGAAVPAATAHPSWIGTRLVTGKNPIEVGDANRQIVDMDAMRATPKLYEKNVGVVRDYPNLPEHTAKNGTTDEVANHFIDHVKNNLLWLHDQVPAATAARSQLWYDGGRKIVDDWSKQYGIPDASVAGAIAALSPQKDWYMNVSMAKRVLDRIKGAPEEYNTLKVTPEMEAKYQSLPSMNKPEYQPMFDAIKGKSLGDIDRMSGFDDKEKSVLKAMWVRLHDEAHNSPAYRLVTPEGGFGANVTKRNGEDAAAAWGSLVEISKAIRAAESRGTREEISQLMGEKHKVRNFYNNLLDPNSPHGDVTIDTHAVAAGLLRPLSGNSLEVAHNFENYAGKGMPGVGGSDNTGIRGTYPLYAEAYRRAAAERGLLPRQMQSITWEAVRGLFPDVFKTAKNNAAINDIWNQYRTGRLGIDDVRNKIHDLAGGIERPTWERPADVVDAQAKNTSQPKVVSRSGVPRTPAEGTRSGRGSEPPPLLPGNLGDLTRAHGGGVWPRRAPDGHFYVPDHARPGKYLRLLHHG